MRNWLKEIYWSCLANHTTPPDMVVTSHTHDSTYNAYIQDRPDGGSDVIHGLILPSWQGKTRFANGILPFAVNRIGLAYFIVSSGGAISTPRRLLMATDDD